MRGDGAPAREHAQHRRATHRRQVLHSLRPEQMSEAQKDVPVRVMPASFHRAPIEQSVLKPERGCTPVLSPNSDRDDLMPPRRENFAHAAVVSHGRRQPDPAVLRSHRQATQVAKFGGEKQGHTEDRMRRGRSQTFRSGRRGEAKGSVCGPANACVHRSVQPPPSG